MIRHATQATGVNDPLKQISKDAWNEAHELEAVVWADRPAAADHSGELIFITDLGSNGALCRSNGTRWLALGPVVWQLGETKSVGATTDETILHTITIPAAAPGPNGWLRISHGWTYSSSAQTKTGRARIGGVAGSIVSHVTTNNSGVVSGQHVALLFNRNASNSQKALTGTNQQLSISSTVAPPTFAIDFSAAQSLVFTGQKGLSGETISLEVAAVELFMAP